MFKRSLLFFFIISLCWTSLAFAQRDAIDLSRAVVVNSPGDVASWPITTRVESLTMSPEGTREPGIAMHFSGRETWPNYHVPGWEPGGEGLQYTVWAGVNIRGTWYVSGFIQMWRTRVATGAPILTHPAGCPSGGTNFACNWAYDIRWGPMSGYNPQAGEAMVFFTTAGNARGVTTVTSVRERSNVVMVNLPANDTGTFVFGRAQTDLLIDFGASGMWTLYDGAQFSQISSANPKNMVTGDLDGNGVDEVIADMGDGVGIWVRWNGGAWSQLNVLSSESMVTGDLDKNGRLEVIFGFPAVGTWAFANGTTWWKLNDQSASQMIVTNTDGGGQDLVLNFPGVGLLMLRNASSWGYVHYLSPTDMAAGDFDGNGVGDVAFAFPGVGLWMLMNGMSWVQVHSLDAVHLAAGDVDGNNVDDLVADFGPALGIWLRPNGGGWSPVHGMTSEQILLGDLDGNGQDDIIIDFGSGGGVWILGNLAAWIHAHSTSPEQMVIGSFN